MKKIFLIVALALGAIAGTNAQSRMLQRAIDKAAEKGLKKVETAATNAVAPSATDVKSLSSSVMTKLNTALTLTKVQEPKVTTLVTDFLTKKSDILALAKTDKAQYQEKLTELTTTLTTKLKKVLTAEQLTKFASLKPAKKTTKDVLSQLFY